MQPFDNSDFATPNAVADAVGSVSINPNCAGGTGSTRRELSARVNVDRSGVSAPGVASALVRDALKQLWIQCELDEPITGTRIPQYLSGRVLFTVQIVQPSLDGEHDEVALTATDFEIATARWLTINRSWPETDQTAPKADSTQHIAGSRSEQSAPTMQAYPSARTLQSPAAPSLPPAKSVATANPQFADMTSEPLIKILIVGLAIIVLIVMARGLFSGEFWYSVFRVLPLSSSSELSARAIRQQAAQLSHAANRDSRNADIADALVAHARASAARRVRRP